MTTDQGPVRKGETVRRSHDVREQQIEASRRMAPWSAAWGAVAGVLGGGAVESWITAVAPRASFPFWPAPTLTALAAAAMYMCFACLAEIWPVPGKGKRHLLKHVDLAAEHVGNHLRLRLANHGAGADFLVQVIRILDPMQQRIPPQGWTIPWFEDGSVGQKHILKGAVQILDLAIYDVDAVNAEIATGDGDADHWRFSAGGQPVGARYYHLRERYDLEVQRFTVVVRIINASSGRSVDVELSVGVRENSLVCEIGGFHASTSGPVPPADKR